MATDPKVISVAQAIKMSFEVNAGAGSSVNAHPNAFFLNIAGAVDLYKAAEAALHRAAAYDKSLAATFEFNVKHLVNRIREEMNAGAVSVADAVARIKTKAGGELLAAEGVLEEAIAWVRTAREIAKPIAKP